MRFHLVLLKYSYLTSPFLYVPFFLKKINFFSLENINFYIQIYLLHFALFLFIRDFFYLHLILATEVLLENLIFYLLSEFFRDVIFEIFCKDALQNFDSKGCFLNFNQRTGVIIVSCREVLYIPYKTIMLSSFRVIPFYSQPNFIFRVCWFPLVC